MISALAQQTAKIGDLLDRVLLPYWPWIVTGIIVLGVGYMVQRRFRTRAEAPLSPDTLGTTPRPNHLGYNVSRRQRKAITKQAIADYKMARGYAHRLLLTEALARLTAQLTTAQKAEAETKAHIRHLEQQQKMELQAALELHLIQTKMAEIPGIGEALRQRILEQTQARSLNDLERASTVSGVGAARMSGIRQWLQSYQAQLPALLAKPFPGSAAIKKKFTIQINATTATLQTQTQSVATLTQQQTALAERLAPLNNMTEEHFVRAAFGSLDDQASVEQFQRGLFAEWEPMPLWFKIWLEENPPS